MWQMAIHEAGHIFMGGLMSMRIESVDMNGYYADTTTGRHGLYAVTAFADKPADATAALLLSVAGCAAEQFMGFTPIPGGARVDKEQAYRLVENSAERKRAWRLALKNVERIFSLDKDAKPTITEIAKRLVEKGKIVEADIADLRKT